VQGLSFAVFFYAGLRWVVLRDRDILHLAHRITGTRARFFARLLPPEPLLNPWRRIGVPEMRPFENFGLRTLSPGLKVIEEMVMSAERAGEVCVEVPKVAVSPALTGARPPNQLVPVFSLGFEPEQIREIGVQSIGSSLI
jgi:hypothetical protein